MPTPILLTTCIRNRKLTHDVREITLRLPERHNFTFTAGQFVLFDVPLVDDPNDIQPRAYSIGSPPRERDELTFVIRYKEGGRCSRWIDEVLKEGDSVRIHGPLGAFVLDSRSTKDFVFVGTGTGVAPFRSHVKWALETQKDERPMRLFFGARHEEDLFWVHDFRMLEETFPNFTVFISLSQPGNHWKGLKGRVTDILPTVVTDFSNISAYVCGNPTMVNDVKQWLISRGVPKSDVHHEGYV